MTSPEPRTPGADRQPQKGTGISDGDRGAGSLGAKPAHGCGTSGLGFGKPVRSRLQRGPRAGARGSSLARVSFRQPLHRLSIAPSHPRLSVPRSGGCWPPATNAATRSSTRVFSRWTSASWRTSSKPLKPFTKQSSAWALSEAAESVPARSKRLPEDDQRLHLRETERRVGRPAEVVDLLGVRSQLRITALPAPFLGGRPRPDPAAPQVALSPPFPPLSRLAFRPLPHHP